MSGEKAATPVPRAFDLLEHEWRKSLLATVNTHGDERAAVLALAAVLARLDRIEALLAGQDNTEPPECTCPFRWTTHYRTCPLYVVDLTTPDNTDSPLVPFLAADCDTCAEDGTTDYHDSHDHAQYHGGKNGMVPQENTDSSVSP